MGNDGAPVTARAILERSSSEGASYGVTQLPAGTIFLLDLTLDKTNGEVGFVRVVVSSARSILEFMAAQDIVDMKITVIQARSAESPEPEIETVVELEVLPPQLLCYTLESGSRFAVVGHSEPRRVQSLFSAASAREGEASA
ncbi:hypothetical protein LJR034_005426 [Caballeronia sp. LjRoot34]|uniref:hypothetical protein n=1 Tax=Caballeronia sp. LjRoot34 TaxID=3342325 RepID=UPI003ECCECEB